MNGIAYSNGEPLQGSFQYKSHQNLSVAAVASTSAPIASSDVVLSLTVAAHVAINQTATSASMVLPAGVWFLRFPKGGTISVLKLTGAEDGQASVIITE